MPTYTYNLSNVTATFEAGSAQLSGTFTVDTTRGTITAINVIATGPTPNPHPRSPITFDTPQTLEPRVIVLRTTEPGVGEILLRMFFNNNILEGNSPLSIHRIHIMVVSGGGDSERITGSMVR
jgi:hypothetical protein